MVTWQGSAGSDQGKAKTVDYALCAKAGYTDDLLQLAGAEPGVYLFTLADLGDD